MIFLIGMLGLEMLGSKCPSGVGFQVGFEDSGFFS